MMVDESQLREIETRVGRTSGSSWELARASTGEAVIKVCFDDGREEVLSVIYDSAPASVPASDSDVEFIAHAHRDLSRLIAAVRGQEALDAAGLAEIRARTGRASAAPWLAWLESDGGSGGSSVILVGGFDAEGPDMRLLLGSADAPDADWEFVAEARRDVPMLLQALEDEDRP